MRCVFLDRDGTLNIDKDYLYKIDDFEFIPKAVDALHLVDNTKFLIIIITGQSGIGRGYYTEEDFKKLTKYIAKILQEKGVIIADTFFCPHAPMDRCLCRKPQTKLLTDASKKFKINLNDSYMVGDKTSDIKMGKTAGCKTILVKTGKGGNDNEFGVKPDFTAKDLYEAIKWINKNEA